MGNPRTPRRHVQPIIAEPLEPRGLLAIDAFAGHNSDIEPSAALFAQAGPIPSLTPEGLIETTASLSASPSAADHGTEIGFTIDVIGSEPFDPLPSGTVSIYAGTELLTTVPVGNGFATWNTSTLPVGIHEIHAEYSGDAAYAPSTSAPVSLEITGVPVSISAQFDNPIVDAGQLAQLLVQLTDDVVAGPASVGARASLREDGNEIAFTFIDDAGLATFTVTTDAAGTRTFSVFVEATSHHQAALFEPLTLTVQPVSVPVTVSLTLPHIASYYGRLLPATILLTTGDASTIEEGTVELRDVLTGRVVATQPANSVIDLALLLPPGENRLRAYFFGSDDHAPANSATIKVVIQPTPTATQLKVIPNADPTLPPRLKATVTRVETGTPPGVPAPIGGKIIFKIDGNVLAKVDVIDGRATFDVPSTYMGRIATFAAIYRGDVGFEPSTSPNRKGDLRFPSTTLLPTSKILGSETSNTRLEATVETPEGLPISGGKVQFVRNDLPTEVLATATVIDGHAVVNAQLPPGMYELRAVYLGGPAHLPSQAPTTASAWIHFATRVDIMIAYTPNAASSVNGLAALKTIALDAVDQMNRALLNSQIDVTVRLVRVVKVEYTESGVYDTDLERLQRTSDGHLDTIHAQRDKFGADLVSLFVGGEGADDTIGLAYRMAEADAAEAPFGFSVVQASEANNSQYTLAHELGHNFGASHDKENASGGALIAPYAYGYRFTASGVFFHDIMSYPPGKAILYFSNPDVSYKGTPTGDPKTSDLARLFTTTAPHISRYRNERVPLGTEVI